MKNSFKVLVSFMLIAFSQLSIALDQPEATVNGAYQVEGNWSGLKLGWNMLELKITDASGQSVIGETLDMTYDMVGMPMSPPNNSIIEKGNGQYEKKIFLGMSGKWKFDMKLTKNTIEDSFSKIQNINH